MKAHLNPTRVLLLVVAVALIGFGIYRGEVDAVFNKAINICLECIGIG
ncbi:MAG: CD1871A family CXXC motif-containing protein [Syntrophomonas sp.]